jgi:hypothetical protein
MPGSPGQLTPVSFSEVSADIVEHSFGTIYRNVGLTTTPNFHSKLFGQISGEVSEKSVPHKPVHLIVTRVRL